MPLHVFPALILRSYEAGSTSEVIHTFSAQFGRLSVYAKGLRSPRNRFRAFLEPLSLVELTINLPENATMGTLREAFPSADLSALAADLERYALATLLAEAAAASCEENAPAEDLFAALLQALQALDPAAGHPAPTVAAQALHFILQTAGYAPQFDDAILAPWPASQPRPHLFWLDVREGFLHADGQQPSAPPQWPQRLHPAARQVPLPPEAIRFLYDTTRGRAPAPLAEPHALQTLQALVLLCQHHQEVTLRSWGFFAEMAGI